MGTTDNPFSSQTKFATIGRSNPFSSNPSPAKNSLTTNPFLEPAVPAPASPMSTTGSSSPLNSPEGSLEPVVVPTEAPNQNNQLNKIETSFAQSQPVTRSLSSVGKKGGQQSASRLPVLASNLSKSNSMNNKNNLNNKINNATNNITNGNNYNLINNNEKPNNNTKTKTTNMED